MSGPNGQPQPSQQQQLASTPGYLSPEEQQRRQQLDQRANEGMNMGVVTQYQRQAAADDARNKAAGGGGFRMDVDQMRALLPAWESIKTKLDDLVGRSSDLAKIRPPAMDSMSEMQIQATYRHQRAYADGVKQQRDYAARYIDALKTAIQSTTSQNEQAFHDTRRAGRNS